LIVDLPLGWELRDIKVLRDGYDPLPAEIVAEDGRSDRYRVSFTSSSDPLVVVLGVVVGDETPASLAWRLTPLEKKGREVRADFVESVLVPVRVESERVHSENLALTFESEASLPVFLRQESLPDMSPSNPFTVQFWLRTTGLGEVVLSAWNGDENVPYPFDLLIGDDGQLFCYRGQPGEHQTMMTRRPAADGLWHHIAMTNDPDAGWTRLYMDGLPVDSLYRPSPMGIELKYSVAIGGRSPLPDSSNRTKSFSGMIDEVQFWQESRTGSEIRSTMYQPLQVLGDNLVALGFETPLPESLLAPRSGPGNRREAGLSFYQPIRNLRAVTEDRNVELSWTTHDRHTVAFIIQRSHDGRDFEEVGRVSAGLSHTDGLDETYRFLDSDVSGRVLFYRIIQQFKTGSEQTSGTIKMGVGGQEEQEDAVLIGNFPNPFNPQTTIDYSLRTPQHVRLSVWDLAGQQVALLVDEDQGPGYYEVPFVAQEQPSGTYFIRMRVPGGGHVRQMILTK